MALASSSSSVLRSTSRLAGAAAPVVASRAGRARRVIVDGRARAYSAAATASASPDVSPAPAYSSAPSSSRPSLPKYTRSPGSSSSEITATEAQAYLSDLLALPSDRQFPPELALQILTHKSYRYSHPIRHNRTSSHAQTASNIGSEPHNSRLSFLGRRAISTYLSIFAHDAFRGRDLQVEGSDFLRGLSLEQRLDNLRNTNNLGRTVGTAWRVGDVVRWDRNETSRESGDLKIRGMAVESILGGIFTQFGSPAAHRTFHRLVLPHLVSQLKDPRLVDNVGSIQRQLDEQFGRSILVNSSTRV
ncbi:hypothetical protein I317_06656 [Kwoniella heveanensis CBS 569]|uniref:RNase III domain-containing protein n=1 Tax=Kwoniella heveanensis BCC8398 TaxID=1296120 RepID=A0A1B9GW45_9TREE|nr:hypothetical protein I316_03176 [Kwoniella heveanensis BCC8398]OCF39546.1 hypothetical protein I317_06656 [Kwoniella heveanensis CBS 569]